MSTYICSMCKGTFKNPDDWSDEDAKDELAKTFDGVPVEECDIVCDDCYNRVMGIMT